MYLIASEVLVNNFVITFSDLLRSFIAFQLLLKRMEDVLRKIVTPTVFM